MGGVEHFAVAVQKGAEMHQLVVFGMRVFSGHKVARHAHLPADLMHQIRSPCVSEIAVRQQFEGIAEREAQQFEFIEGVVVLPAVQLGQYKAFGGCKKKVLRGPFTLLPAEVQAGLPEQGLFWLSGEP